MSVDCVDLTSDPELDLTADVQPRTKAPEVLSLLSDSDDAGSPLKQANSSAGIKRKRNAILHKPVRKMQPKCPPAGSSLQAVQNSSAQTKNGAALPRQSAPAASNLALVDEDDDLCVELAFAKKPKPSSQHPEACTSFGAPASTAPMFAGDNDSSKYAAFASNPANDSLLLVRLPSQPLSFQAEVSGAAEDDGVYDVPDDSPDGTAAPKAAKRKKARRNNSDDLDEVLTKEEKKATAAEQRERKKAEAAQEKERKKQQREQDKAAKLAAKEEQKQDKQREKVESRASKGYYALHEITAILDTQLVADPLGSLIMDKLRKCSGKPTCPCSGIKFEIQANPMRPLKSIMWQRSSVAEPGVAMKASDAENVPYILLYFTAAEFVVEVEKDGFQSVMQRCAEVHPGCTLGLLVDKLDFYLRQQEQKGFRENIRNGDSNAGRFRRAKTDLFLADLAVQWPGVRHMLALDPNQAAEHVVNLTCALGVQPYKAQETWLYAFGGTKETPALRTLLVENPIAHKEREGWFHALAHVSSVKPGPAHAIATHFPSMGALLSALMDPCMDQRAMQKLLENLQQPSNRRVGPMAAKKLIGMLMAEDPLTPMDDLVS